MKLNEATNVVKLFVVSANFIATSSPLNFVFGNPPRGKAEGPQVSRARDGDHHY